MLRIILGLKKKQQANMQKVRHKIKMMSVNQVCCYHTLLEAYNVIQNSSSEQIRFKWENYHENKYSFRNRTKNDPRIPDKRMKTCIGFSYNDAKRLSNLPSNVKETSNPSIFKSMIKNWIWENIPSY